MERFHRTRATSVHKVVCLVVGMTFVFACNSSADGRLHFGAKGITSWSHFDNDTYVTGYHLGTVSGGLFAVYDLSDNWAVQPEFRYVRRGDRVVYYSPFHNVANTPYYAMTAEDIRHTLHYLEVPILVRYSLIKADNSIPYLIGGPVIQKVVSAGEKTSGCRSITWEGTENFDLASRRDVHTSGLEWAFVVGTGMEIRLTRGVMTLEGRYCQSLKNADYTVHGSGETMTIKNAIHRTFSFEAGYIIW
jgi:hypothetical protein